MTRWIKKPEEFEALAVVPDVTTPEQVLAFLGEGWTYVLRQSPERSSYEHESSYPRSIYIWGTTMVIVRIRNTEYAYMTAAEFDGRFSPAPA